MSKTLKKKFLLGQKPDFSFDFDGFKLEIFCDEKYPEKNYALVTTKANDFSMMVTGFCHGYLTAGAIQDRRDSLHGFCTLMYVLTDRIFQDPELAESVMDAVNASVDRLLTRGGRQAAEVTEEEEESSEALLRQIVNDGASKSDKGAKAEVAAILRDVIGQMVKTE